MAMIQAGDVSLHFEDEGSGAPLLLLHPAASSGVFFAETIEQLRDTYRLIVPDLRGLGRSSRVNGPLDPRVWIADLVNLLGEVGVEQPVVVGTSLGSRLGGRLAIEHPELVRALVVDAPMIGLAAGANAALRSQLSAVPEAGSPAAVMFEEWHGAEWPSALDFYAATRSAPAFQEYLTLAGELEIIEAPTLVIRGDKDDPVHPLGHAMTWHAEAPNTDLWIAPGTHEGSLISERLADFKVHLAAFLERRCPDFTTNS